MSGDLQGGGRRPHSPTTLGYLSTQTGISPCPTVLLSPHENISIIPIWGKRCLNPNEGFWARPPACGGRARLAGGRPFRAGRQPKRAYMTAIGISLVILWTCSPPDQIPGIANLHRQERRHCRQHLIKPLSHQTFLPFAHEPPTVQALKSPL